MQQRVNLVRAFALGSPVLLMDEPFAALAEITRAQMRTVLLSLWVLRAALRTASEVERNAARVTR